MTGGADPLGGLPPAPVADRPEPRPAPTGREGGGRVRRAPVAVSTWLVLGPLAAVFLLQLLVGGGMGDDSATLDALGALVASLVQQGELWRLGSYAFLHVGPIHLLVNAWALSSLLREVEGASDRVGALGVFAITALAAGGVSAAHALLSGQDVASAGASGGAFGLFGALGVIYWRLRSVLPPEVYRAVMRSLGINLVLNGFLFVASLSGGLRLDNYAHLGGLLSGALVGLAVPLRPLPRRPIDRLVRGVLVAGIIVLVGCEVMALGHAFWRGMQPGVATEVHAVRAGRAC